MTTPVLVLAAGAATGTLILVSPYHALSVEALKIFLSLFFGIIAIRSTYSTLVYPYFLSPLRDLPGPKVGYFVSPLSMMVLGSYERPRITTS